MQINKLEGLDIKGKMIFTLRDLEGNIVKVVEKDNLIVNTFKNLIAGILNSETTYTGKVNYLAVGTGANAPTVADTQLQTELARKTINVQSRSGNQVTIEFYFAPTEANGNLKEAGAFIDGSGTANSGQLVDRLNIDVAKTAVNSLTVTLVLTVG